VSLMTCTETPTRTAVPTSDNAVRTKRSICEMLGVDVSTEDTFLGSCIPDVCLRIGVVSSITGLSIPTIYREIAQGRFPRPIRITAGARAWKLSEIMDWIDTRERDCGPNAASKEVGKAA
jgi:prophage regulatory protein